MPVARKVWQPIFVLMAASRARRLLVAIPDTLLATLCDFDESLCVLRGSAGL